MAEFNFVFEPSILIECDICSKLYETEDIIEGICLDCRGENYI
jgi:hypothetical protein